MISTTIANTPYIVFLGAGASDLYGKLLMKPFLDEFRRKQPIDNHLLNAICADRDSDLEILMQELQSLASKRYLESATYLEIYPSLIGDHSGGQPPVSPQKKRWPEFANVAIEARSLLSKLKREIYSHYRSISDSKLTDVLLRPINFLKEPSFPSVVFTTNYDPSVEDFCRLQKIRLIDGFQQPDEYTQEYVWNRNAFDVVSTGVENTLVLFKLHGSTTWHLDRDKIIKGPSLYSSGDDRYNQVMIYPATSKVAVNEPYFTSYDYLGQCLEKARGCVVIGYSFRDYDTLMKFKSACLSNPMLKVIVFDPCADAICDRLRDSGIHNVRPVNYRFIKGLADEYLPLIAGQFQRQGMNA